MDTRKRSKNEERTLTFIKDNLHIYADETGTTPTSRIRAEAETSAKKAGTTEDVRFNFKHKKRMGESGASSVFSVGSIDSVTKKLNSNGSKSREKKRVRMMVGNEDLKVDSYTPDNQNRRSQKPGVSSRGTNEGGEITIDDAGSIVVVDCEANKRSLKGRGGSLALPRIVQSQFQEKTNTFKKQRNSEIQGRNKYMRAPSVPISRAKNILELNTRMGAIYEQSLSTLTKEHVSTIDMNSRMEKKLDNIMHKLKSRFNKETHRANNERLVHEYRQKMRMNASKEESNMFDTVGISKWTDSTFQGHHPQPMYDQDGILLQVQSSGLIKEVSQELESLGESQNQQQSNQSMNSIQPIKISKNYDIQNSRSPRQVQYPAIKKKSQFGYTAYEGRHLKISDNPYNIVQRIRKPTKATGYLRDLPHNNPIKARPQILEEIILSGDYKKRFNRDSFDLNTDGITTAKIIYTANNTTTNMPTANIATPNVVEMKPISVDLTTPAEPDVKMEVTVETGVEVVEQRGPSNLDNFNREIRMQGLTPIPKPLNLMTNQSRQSPNKQSMKELMDAYGSGRKGKQINRNLL